MTDEAPTVSFDLSEAERASLQDLVIRGMGRGGLDPALQASVEAGLVMVKGPIVMPTQEGTALVGTWVRLSDDAPERERVTHTFRTFLPVNRRLRELCTAWQCRPDGSMNDHGDPAYDVDVRDRLDDIHHGVIPLLRRLGTELPSVVGYEARLQMALDELDDGNNAWFASPLIDSYHTVWMHLHQELILTLGITRAEDEALEEHLVSGAGG